MTHPTDTYHRFYAAFTEAAGYQGMYLPLYSPDLDRIERCWAGLKSRIRTVLANVPSLRAAMELVLKEALS